MSYHLPFYKGKRMRSCVDLRSAILDKLGEIGYTFDPLRRPAPLALRKGFNDREFLVKLFNKITQQIEEAQKTDRVDYLCTLSISVCGFCTSDTISCRLYSLSLYGDGKLIDTHFGDYSYIMGYVNSHLNNSRFLTKYVVIS